MLAIYLKPFVIIPKWPSHNPNISTVFLKTKSTKCTHTQLLYTCWTTHLLSKSYHTLSLAQASLPLLV